MARKKTLETEPKAEKAPVTLVSYTMKAVIPVMEYGNIQPEITLTARTIAEAEEVAIAHIEALFERYVPKKKEQLPTVTLPVVDVPAEPKVHAPKTPELATNESVTHTDAYTRGKKMIEATRNVNSLRLMQNSVATSATLTAAEKTELTALLESKLA